jgi:predicted MFS family arabinose efflux permease
LASELPTRPAESAQQWLLVSVATCCGFAAAYNIGKLPPSIPALRAEFSTTLTSVAALVSSYSLIAMTCSLLMGGVVARLGIWRTVAGGLCLLIAGGLIGATTHEFEILLFARVLEGIGYLAIAITMPAFIGRVCTPSSRSVALGVWGTFVPGGITLCMLLAPWLSSLGGWRALWWGGVLVALVLLVLAVLLIRPAATSIEAAANQPRPAISSVFTRTNWLLTVCFAVYSMCFTGLATFLPTYWSETFAAVSLASATQWTALVISVNIIGNLCGGWLNQAGVSLRALILTGTVVAAAFGVLTYFHSLSFHAQLISACLFTFLSGITPATLFVTASRVTASPAQNGLLVGLLFQGAGCGQVFGPLLVGGLVDSAGDWSVVPWYFVLCGTLSAIVVFLLPRRLHHNDR